MIGRLATENDLPKLVDLGREFMTEGRWGWTYSDSRAAKTFLTSILHPECDTVSCRRRRAVTWCGCLVIRK
jgi:hypothetical protein